MSTIAKACAARAAKGTGDVEFRVEVYYEPELLAVTVPTELREDLSYMAIDPCQILVLLRGNAVQHVEEPVVRDMTTLADVARDLLHGRLKQLQKQGTIHEFNIGDPQIVRWD